MSRILQTAAKAKLAAFDFDVVTDMPARPQPARKSEAADPSERPEPEPAKTAET
jgi:hypothetical protein